MKRSRASRPALDRLAIGSALALPWLARRGGARAGSAGPAPRRTRTRAAGASRFGERVGAALSVPAPALRSLALVLARRRWLRLLAIALAIAAPLLCGGWLWLRSSSLVAVERVQVSGVHGPDARAIEQALVAAGRRMTTLQVNRRGLLAAVAPFHLVRSLTVSTSFPHGLRVQVAERLPVATLTVAGAQTAVGADGTVLGQAFVSGRLPRIAADYMPPAGALVHDAALRGELAILGAAPAVLRRFLARAFPGPHGLTVKMRNGLEAYFGDASRPHAKWLALALVLGDPSSAHASAVDVRTPERPAADFPAGSAPATAAPAEAGATPGGSSESIIAALAASAGYGSSTEAHEANAAKAAEALAPSEGSAAAPPGTGQGG